MGKYQKIREIIREVMKDGKVHTAEEFEKICEKKGIKLYNDRGPIYNVVHQLKAKGEIASDGENGYVAPDSDSAGEEVNSKHLLTEIKRIDLAEFEIVSRSVRKRTKQVISIFENGDVAFNDALVKVLGNRDVEIRIKKDCGQLLLLPDGENKIEIGKNHRFKNYEIYDRLIKRRIRFPAYYVGEWDDENMLWLGDLTTMNPNKSVAKKA